jgi:hypothetical protein
MTTYLFAFNDEKFNSILVDADGVQHAIEILEDLNVTGDCYFYELTKEHGEAIPPEYKHKLLDHHELKRWGIMRLTNSEWDIRIC